MRRRRSGRPPTVVAAVAALALASVVGCRDTPEPFEPPELEPLGPAPYQLTFDPGREVSPAWSADGQEVIYVSERTILNRAAVPLAGPQPPDSAIVFDTIRTSGILRAIPRQGGIARKLLPVLQPQTTSVPIDFAAQASTEEVAALTMLPVLGRDLCGGVSPCSTDLEAASPPRLTAAVIRVRAPGSAVPPDADTRLEVTFEGRDFDTSQNPGGVPGVWVVDKHPFQQLFNATGRAPNRLSWSPEGDRIVFSDGLALHIWNPSSGSVTMIAGTEDGVDPAWSPTGDWIVFERAVRGAVTEQTCEYAFGGNCIEQRRTWTIPSRSLALVRPDGSELRVFPAGSRPAWGAAGQRIYYESGRRIWSVGLDGQDPAPVPATVEGYHPAVSPDGQSLAFARMDSLGATSDIWIVEVE